MGIIHRPCCQEHQSYMGIDKSLNDCESCKELYNLHHPVCNMCGRNISHSPNNPLYQEEVITIENHFGYFSEKDGDIYKLNMCEECFDKMVEQCKIPPHISSGHYY